MTWIERGYEECVKCYTFGMDYNLLELQDSLQAEAHQVLNDLGLIEFLRKYGEPVLVGSIDSGLMTWRDIDLSITKDPVEAEMWEIAQYLFAQAFVKSVWVADYRNRTDSPYPHGLYVGVKYKKELAKQWKIDLWLKPSQADVDKTEALKKKLTDATRLTILTIKSQVADHPGYRHTFYSTDIYEAVLEHGITDINGFTTFLQGKGITL